MNGRIAILGAGAIGLYYGARLALAGRDVSFLARSDLTAIRERGITLTVEGREDVLKPAAVFARAEDIGPVDLVILTLKATANAELAHLLPPLLGPATRVLTLQNGLGSEDTVARWVDRDRILGGLCYIACMRLAPAEVTCLHAGSIALGEADGPARERTRELAASFESAGVACRVVDDLVAARWRKLIWNVPFNGLSIAAGAVTTDVLCADPALRGEVQALMREVQAAARQLGIDIPDDVLRKQYDVTPPMGPYRPSSLVDFLAGRPLEIEAIWGEPLRRAQAAGAAMPRLALLYALLRRIDADRTRAAAQASAALAS
jgi:2-dehydropantoate 2-reductase